MTSQRVNMGSRVFKLETSAVTALCSEIGTPRALTVALLIASGEWDQLAALSIDARHYNCHRTFGDDYLVSSVMSKNPRLPTSFDRKEVAIRKFFAAEDQCAKTNTRIRDFVKSPQSWDPWYLKMFFQHQQIIQGVLSAFPNRYDLSFAEKNMRFGPGATTSVTGVVTQGRKYNARCIHCTSSLVGFRAFCLPYLWRQNVPEVKIQDHSKLTTVPKNAKTDRVICIEPDLNIFVQLGIGALLKRKLMRDGLDLSSQDFNRFLAGKAQEWDLATVDLAAASDTVSYETVARLLPPAWVDLFELCRTPSTCLDGTIIPLEKWSSMGNGYTFELESLIFWTLIKSIVPETEWCYCSVFGDDCILPRKYLADFTKALDFLGFSVNTEKTFGEGRFFESCGTDFFDGHNVRPFYFRSDNHDFNSICYLYANNISRWASRRNGGWSRDSRCLPSWLRCFRAVKPSQAYRIPDGYGDVGFISDFDENYATRVVKHGLAGYEFDFHRVRSIETSKYPEGCYLATLNSSLQDTSGGIEALRGRFRKPHKQLGTSFEWPDLGPWL